MTIAPWLRPALLSLAFSGIARADPPAADKPYRITTDAPNPQVGKSTRAEIQLLPGSGMHVNTKYPPWMTLLYPEGIEGPAGKIKPTRVERTGAHFDLVYTARSAGRKQLVATVSFAVCNDANTQCDPRREKVSITVDAK
jgi:hypothetical protein